MALSTTFTQCTLKSTKFGIIKTQNTGKAISPFKVTDFGINQKLICDFLSVININLHAILHHLRDSRRNVNKKCKVKNPRHLHAGSTRVLMNDTVILSIHGQRDTH